LPQFKVDPFWPRPLPGNWMLGQVSGIAVDRNDHIWIVHRPSTLADDEKGAQLNPPTTHCCVAAPPVLEFDASGNLLRSWGGPGQGYDWFESEHGIFVDNDGNVWVGGNGTKDHHLVQFTADGKFIKQLGKPGKSEGSNATSQQLGRPAHMVVDAAANELYVADGYGNRRVVVFDATRLTYKRHWGAYGERPHDEKQPPYDPRAALSRSFQNPVHCVRISNDGLVYVCDRNADRIQVFEKSGKFVTEFIIEPETRQSGSVADLVFSEDPAQQFLFVGNISSGYVMVVERATGRVVSKFGRPGRMAGELKTVHNLAIDSKGNVYTAEVGTGRRAQKFSRLSSN
jgi:DNA-binding beta-propeller fold protein YncE